MLAQDGERRIGRPTLRIHKTRCRVAHSQHHTSHVFSSAALVSKLDNRGGLSAATIALSTTADTVTTIPAPVGSSLEVLCVTRGSEVDLRETRAKEDIGITKEVAKLRYM